MHVWLWQTILAVDQQGVKTLTLQPLPDADRPRFVGIIQHTDRLPPQFYHTARARRKPTPNWVLHRSNLPVAAATIRLRRSSEISRAIHAGLCPAVSMTHTFDHT